MNRDEIYELAAGYALGTLDLEDRERFEVLLNARDAEAVTALREFQSTMTDLATEGSVTPSPGVKAALMARIDAEGVARAAVVRTLETKRPERARWPVWSMVLTGAMAAGIAAIAVGLAVSSAYDRRLAQLQHEAAAIKEELNRQQAIVTLLQDPATRFVSLGALEPAAGASARMVWHKTAGGLLVVQGMPPTPAGKAYELWAIPPGGSPIPAGVFTVDAKGAASLRVSPVAAGTDVETFAVTLEPASGGPAPTGAMYLAGKL
jgi:anti-sigma-K factor RskA